MKILIIGGSHAGQAAVKATLATYPTATVILIDQQTVTVPTSSHLTCLTETTATAVLPASHQVKVTLANGQAKLLVYDKLILAPGASAILPTIPGNHLDGVMTVRSRTDLQKIHSIIQDSTIQRIAIVGGGYIGVGMADMFSQKGKQVTLIDHGSRILKTYLDAPMTQQIQTELAGQKVQFKLGVQITALTGKSHVQSITVGSEELATDLVIFAVGNRPQTQWLPAKLVDSNSHLIPVDEYFQTPVTDVFALGDAVALSYQPLDSKRNIALASNADRAGTIVVLNLMQPSCRFKGVVGTSLWQAGSLQFSTTGLTRSAAQDAGVESQCVNLTQQLRNTENQLYEIQCQLLYATSTHRILGAQLLSNGKLDQLINVFALAVQQRLTLTDLAQADFYMTPGINSLPNVANAVAFAGLSQELKRE